MSDDPNALESRAPPRLCRPSRLPASLRRGRRRPAGRAAARLSRLLVELALPGPGAGRGRVSGGRARHARLQPVVATAIGRRLRHRPVGGRHPRPDPRARRRAGVPRRSRLGRGGCVGYGGAASRGGGAPGDPQRPASAADAARAASPEADPEVLVHVLLPAPVASGADAARAALARVPIRLRARREAWRVQPRRHRALRRGVVAARRRDRDAQLLPGCVPPVAAAGGGTDPADRRADAGDLGRARPLPRRRARRARSRRRSEPRARGQASRELRIGSTTTSPSG